VDDDDEAGISLKISCSYNADMATYSKCFAMAWQAEITWETKRERETNDMIYDRQMSLSLENKFEFASTHDSLILGGSCCALLCSAGWLIRFSSNSNVTQA
jgi:hypothetical protein